MGDKNEIPKPNKTPVEQNKIDLAKSQKKVELSSKSKKELEKMQNELEVEDIYTGLSVEKADKLDMINTLLKNYNKPTTIKKPVEPIKKVVNKPETKKLKLITKNTKTQDTSDFNKRK